MDSNQFPFVRKTSFILTKCLELLNEKSLDRFKREALQELSEHDFLKRYRTVILGLGAQANTVYLTSLMHRDGLVVLDGTLHAPSGINANNLRVLSGGEIKCLSGDTYLGVQYADKIRRVVVFYDPRALDLDLFFKWVASQPHDESIEIILFIS